MSQQPLVTRSTLTEYLARLDAAFQKPGRVYLIGESTQVFEGWRPWTSQIEFTAEVPAAEESEFATLADELAVTMGVTSRNESPGDVIPLPDGFETRSRPASPEHVLPIHLSNLEVHHFDPYSVAFRFIARGDEPDYHLVLSYVENGWITMSQLEEELTRLLPRFTAETIQQDPAEFRRKYKGLQQMSRSLAARSTHRHTAV